MFYHLKTEMANSTFSGQSLELTTEYIVQQGASRYRNRRKASSSMSGSIRKRQGSFKTTLLTLILHKEHPFQKLLTVCYFGNTIPRCPCHYLASSCQSTWFQRLPEICSDSSIGVLIPLSLLLYRALQSGGVGDDVCDVLNGGSCHSVYL